MTDETLVEYDEDAEGYESVLPDDDDEAWDEALIDGDA